MIILEGLDQWYGWWIAFWYAHPVLFLAMCVASVAFTVYAHGRHK